MGNGVRNPRLGEIKEFVIINGRPCGTSASHLARENQRWIWVKYGHGIDAVPLCTDFRVIRLPKCRLHPHSLQMCKFGPSCRSSRKSDITRRIHSSKSKADMKNSPERARYTAKKLATATANARQSVRRAALTSSTLTVSPCQVRHVGPRGQATLVFEPATARKGAKQGPELYAVPRGFVKNAAGCLRGSQDCSDQIDEVGLGVNFPSVSTDLLTGNVIHCSRTCALSRPATVSWCRKRA